MLICTPPPLLAGGIPCRFGRARFLLMRRRSLRCVEMRCWRVTRKLGCWGDCFGVFDRGVGFGEWEVGGIEFEGRKAYGLSLLPRAGHWGFQAIQTLGLSRFFFRITSEDFRSRRVKGNRRFGLTSNQFPVLLFVNIGDLMQIMSNDVYKSMVHRVVANTKEDARISIAVFFTPGKKSDSDLYGALPELVSEATTSTVQEFHGIRVHDCTLRSTPLSSTRTTTA